ncbi:MAG TPA: hypothetical protein VIJ19_10080 [Opitutaceae bacterium]
MGFIQVAPQIARRIHLVCALPDAQLQPLQAGGIGDQAPIEGAEKLAR